MKILALAILLISTGLMAQENVVEYQTESIIKVTPFYGVTMIKNDYLSYTSKVAAGGAVDFMLSPRFSLGVNFNFSRFELYEDLFVYDVLDTDLRKYSAGVMGKYFIIPTGTIRPFVGLGASYVHNKLQPANDRSVPLNNTAYSFGNIAGTLTAGSEVRVSQKVGFTLGYNYSRNLKTGINRKVNEDNLVSGLTSNAMQGREVDLKKVNSHSLFFGLMLNY